MQTHFEKKDCLLGSKLLNSLTWGQLQAGSPKGTTLFIADRVALALDARLVLIAQRMLEKYR